MFNYNYNILWACVASNFMLHSVSSYPSGAPINDKTCNEMAPEHKSKSQNLPAPFVILPSSGTVKPEGILQVTLKKEKEGVNNGFRGFLLQARNKSSHPVGKFIGDDFKTYKIETCYKHLGESDNVVTHVNKDMKDSITLKWKAPKAYEGEITFTATFVQNVKTYWVKVPAAMIVTVG